MKEINFIPTFYLQLITINKQCAYREWCGSRFTNRSALTRQINTAGTGLRLIIFRSWSADKQEIGETKAQIF